MIQSTARLRGGVGENAQRRMSAVALAFVNSVNRLASSKGLSPGEIMAALKAHGGSEFNSLFTVAAMEEEGGSGDPAVDAALFDAVVKLLDDKARVNELVQGGGQATNLLLALLRDAGLGHVAINKHLEHGISKRQFTNAGALGLAFQSAHRELDGQFD